VCFLCCFRCLAYLLQYPRGSGCDDATDGCDPVTSGRGRAGARTTRVHSPRSFGRSHAAAFLVGVHPSACPSMTVARTVTDRQIPSRCRGFHTLDVLFAVRGPVFRCVVCTAYTVCVPVCNRSGGCTAPSVRVFHVPNVALSHLLNSTLAW
jgi:hypothetical protein